MVAALEARWPTPGWWSARIRSPAARPPGRRAARADLFRGRLCILTPTRADAARGARARCARSGKASARASRRWTPAAHDEILARVSHLPHLVAYALVAAVAGARVGGRSRARLCRQRAARHDAHRGQPAPSCGATSRSRTRTRCARRSREFRAALDRLETLARRAAMRRGSSAALEAAAAARRAARRGRADDAPSRVGSSATAAARRRRRCRATSRSGTARCSSARSRTARPSCAGFSGGADVRATLDGGARASARRSADDGDTRARRRCGARAGRGPRRRARLRATPARRCASAMGLVAGAPGACTLDGDALAAPAADGARRRAAARHGCARRDDRRPRRRSGCEGGGLDGDRLDAAGGERAGEVGVLLAGLRARGTHARARAAGEPRPHRAPARAHGRAGRAATAARSRSAGGQRLRARRVAAARRSVVGGVPGRRGAASCRAPRCACATSASTRRARARSRSCVAWARDIRVERTRRRGRGAARRSRRAGVAAARHDHRRRRGAGGDRRAARARRRRGAAPSGETRIGGAAELRVKESDRLAALEQLGAPRRRDDGARRRPRAAGPRRPAARAAAASTPRGDHRIAMAFAVAGLCADGRRGDRRPRLRRASRSPASSRSSRRSGARVEAA